MRRPLLALAAGLLLAAAAPAQPPNNPPSPAFLEGTEAFRRIIFDAGKELSPDGFQALGSFNELNDPKHTLLIVLGDTDRLTEVPGGLQSFLERGGALLLATDKPLRGGVPDAVRAETGATVSGRTVVCDDLNACYHRLNDCPFLEPAPRADPDLFRNLTREGSALSTVATNIPSFLEINLFGRSALPALAWLPDQSRSERPGGDMVRIFSRLPFAVGGDVGDGGRALVLADHSIFINEMMLQQDNGNVEFSYNCLKWLAQGRETRTRVLFVEDGKINTRLEVPLKEVPDELMQRFLDYIVNRLAYVEVAEKATQGLEKDVQAFDEGDGFDRVLLKRLREQGVTPNGLLRVLTVLLAVLVVLYGCWRVGWKARFRSDLQGPLLASALFRLAPAGTVTEQRQKALERGDSLWEPARDLARQCLAEAGAPAGASAPAVVVCGGWLRRWVLAGRVKRLWRLAYGPPAPVSRGAWRRLLREIGEVKAALADGTLQFQ